MECTLATLIACFSWSNLYIDGGAHWQDRGAAQTVLIAQEPDTWTITYPPDNPYGWIGAGYMIEPAHNFELNFRLGAHRSSLKDGDDRGYKYAGLEFRWFPFKRRD